MRAGALGGAVKAPEHFDGECNGFGRQEAVVKDGFSQPGDFAVFVDFDETMRNQAGDFQADGVRSDVNGGEGWRSATVYNLEKGGFEKTESTQLVKRRRFW